MSPSLPPLPKGWTWATVADVGAAAEQAVLTGPFGTSLGPDDFVDASDSAVPVLTIGCLREGDIDVSKATFVTPAKAEELDRYRLRSGDILFSRMATVGRAGFVKRCHEGALFNYHIMRLRLRRDALDPRFFIYYVRSSEVVRAYVRSVNHGMTRDGINTAQLSSLPVPLAPRDHQGTIVNAIEEVTSRLDAAVASLESAQRKLKAYRASVLKAAVEGRLVPTEAELAREEGRSYEPANVLIHRILKERRRRWEEAELAKMKAAGKTPKDDRWKAKYKEPDPPDADNLPGPPEGWCWATTGQLFSFVTSGSRGWAQYYSQSGPTFLRIGNLDHDSISLDLSDIQHVSPPSGAEGTRTRVVPGDVLISITADVGMVAVVPDEIGEAYINQHISLARPVAGLNIHYLAWFLASAYGGQRQFLALQRGATKVGLGLDDIRGVSVPIPPLVEQGRIVGEIERRLSVAAQCVSDSTASRRRIRRLRQAILRSAFEGKLVDQDPADEPGDVLLARIRAEREAAAVAQPRANRARKLKVAS